MNIQITQFNCHSRAKAAGWWDEFIAGDARLQHHFIAGKIALVHSELSEGLEGHRKSLMDDHLPHRKMIEVELADTAIRIFDISGMLGFDLQGRVASFATDDFVSGDSTMRKHFIAGAIGDIHALVSRAHEAWRLGESVGVEHYFAKAVALIIALVALLELDLEGAIKEKLDYNAVRPDHKREARSAIGGKGV